MKFNFKSVCTLNKHSTSNFYYLLTKTTITVTSKELISYFKRSLVSYNANVYEILTRILFGSHNFVPFYMNYANTESNSDSCAKKYSMRISLKTGVLL